LQEVLEKFDGTILLVSHDRYLVDRLATQVWWLHDGRLEVYDGNYQAYLQRRSGKPQSSEDEVAQQELEPVNGPQPQPARLSKNELRRLQQALVQLEEQIGECEYELEQLAHATQEASQQERFDDIKRLSQEYSSTEARLESLMHEWESLAHQLSQSSPEKLASSEEDVSQAILS
jgi:ATP-binding cassette, subfamily F, member 3